MVNMLVVKGVLTGLEQGQGLGRSLPFLPFALGVGLGVVRE